MARQLFICIQSFKKYPDRDSAIFSQVYRCHRFSLKLLHTHGSKFPLSHFQRSPLRHISRFPTASNGRFFSLPFIPTSYSIPNQLQKTFQSHHWRNWGGSGYWWRWWEALVKSVNRRCLLCAGAIFLWDRERVTNQDIAHTRRSLSKYEKRVSGSSKPVQEEVKKSTNDSGKDNENESKDSRDQSHGANQEDKHSFENSTAQTVNGDNEREQTEDQSLHTTKESTPSNQRSNRQEMKRGQNKGKSESRKPRKRMKDHSAPTHTQSRRYKHSQQNERTIKASNKVATKPTSKAQVNKKEQEKKKNKMDEKHFSEEDTCSKSKDEETAVSQPKPSIYVEEVSSALLSATNKDQEEEDPLKGWEFVSKQDNCTVYSKPYGDTGLRQYKVIGFYDDITARDYLDVQVSEDRMSWDSYCVSLDTVDRDSSTGSEVIHWVLKFPFPMASRDYVFVRRHWISSDDDAIILINRACEHPAVPESKRYVRVKSYFSETIIKPDTFIDELGFHYELTYFDDPGTYIPSSAVSWVTKSAMPDFLSKIHKAAVQKQATNQHKQVA